MRMFEPDEGRLRDYVEGMTQQGSVRLPPEPKLSEELGIPRGRLRTILKRLESEGLLWRHVGKGTFAGSRRPLADDPSLTAAISVDNILDARLLLEPQLAAQAAIRATPTDLAAMDLCLTTMANLNEFGAWRRLDERLHRLIAQATHNPMMLVLYDTLRSQMRASLDLRIREVYGTDVGPDRGTDTEHHGFVEAIRAHNPEAAERTMRMHLLSVRNRLFGLR